MPKLVFDQDEIYYEVHGDGAPLLLVSGLGGVAANWRANIPAFAARHRVVLHDHRGTGQSSCPKIRYSVEQMAGDVLRLMDHLGIEAAHFVGHSGGAAIGQTLAATHPRRLKSLVLYSGWTKADAYLHRALEMRLTLLASAGPEAYLRSAAVLFYPPQWVNDNVGLLESREKAAAPGVGDPAIIARRIDAFLAFDRTADLSRLRTPTLVICARDDVFTPPYFSESLARLIPGSELVLLQSGGHFAAEAAPEAFEAAVLSFLSRQPARD